MKKLILSFFSIVLTFVAFSQAKTERTALYEEFTSSTCPPCYTFNISYFNDSYLSSNAGTFTLIKYQMSWPSPGDDYYTEEGGTRRSFYGISGVPTLYLDS
ncbi:MAG: hypothetical protein U9N85_04485, partial [Bacteroidota bacterium]|nr:hypothetical protein [Bacteroidota bacterium]